MLRDQSKLELICKHGHQSEHFKDRVLRHNDAWCPRCGADIKYDLGEEASELPEAA